jgi:hypothetical protein
MPFTGTLYHRREVNRLSSNERGGINTYLREARLTYGCVSTETASEVVPFSKEAIGRHERGDVHVSTDAILAYARGYGRDDILLRYCTYCPVGVAIGVSATEWDFPVAALRLSKQLKTAYTDIGEKLEGMACEGDVLDIDFMRFMRVMDTVAKLKGAITDMELCAAKNGKRKAQPRKGSTNRPRPF